MQKKIFLNSNLVYVLCVWIKGDLNVNIYIKMAFDANVALAILKLLGYHHKTAEFPYTWSCFEFCKLLKKTFENLTGKHLQAVMQFIKLLLFAFLNMLRKALEPPPQV